jgi:signal transduction histidine kinase
MTDENFKYFASLYDRIHFPIQVINEEGKIVYINVAFSFQWGYNLQDLKNYSVYDDPELKKNGLAQNIKTMFETKSYLSFEGFSDSLLKSKEITTPLYRTKLFHTYIDRRQYIILFHEDQTELILTEEEMKKLRENYKEAERLKNTFLNVLSHELRTPLNIILGYSSIIKESLKEKLTSEDKSYLDNLYSGSERLFKSIIQMLEFAQLEAGIYKLSLEKIEINELLRNCVETIRKSAEDKSLKIKMNFKEDLIYTDIDVQAIESTINNLLSNAVKFTKQGFIEVETGILEEKELVFCKIKDSGVGIASEYLDHLFNPFSQEDLGIGRTYEGNGLGLALAKRYVELVGGSLLVDSIKGVGTTFTLTLPLSKYNKRKGTKPKSETQLKKIYMLDEMQDAANLVTAILKNKYEIASFTFSSFKIETFNNKGYEAIIIDVNQNHWDKCLNICREIKISDPFKRPIIILSDEFIENKIQQFLDNGADEFIIKPFKRADILQALKKVH